MTNGNDESSQSSLHPNSLPPPASTKKEEFEHVSVRRSWFESRWEEESYRPRARAESARSPSQRFALKASLACQGQEEL